MFGTWKTTWRQDSVACPMRSTASGWLRSSLNSDCQKTKRPRAGNRREAFVWQDGRLVRTDFVNFHKANAGRATSTAYYRGVSARLETNQQGSFSIIGRRDAARHDV